MYCISDYLISQQLNKEEILLYSTLTTSIIVLENEIFKSIFRDKQFDAHIDICNELENMGFLFIGEENAQAVLLEQIRQEIVTADHGITGMTIAPTMECNARCDYCFEKGAKQGTMSPETARDLANFLIKHCVEKELYIAWFGGEPLLAADMIDLITEQLLAAGIRVESTITTNGLLLTEDIVGKFDRWNVSRVQITLDGIGEAYNRIKKYTSTSSQNPFETVIHNIEMLISHNVNVHLRVNYQSTDYQQVKTTMDYLHERFGSYEKLYLYGAPLDLPEVKGYSEFDADEGEIFLKVLHMSLDRGYENDELDFRTGINLEGDYNAALGELMLSPFPAPCFMVNKWRFAVDDAGYLYKCQKHLGHVDFACGTVKDGIVENQTYKYYVTRYVHNEKCVKCFMFPICQGGCNANRLLYGDKFACPPSKSIAKQLVLSYYNFLENGTYSQATASFAKS